jgi:DNA-binding transcriptional ArsR family regulator
MESSVRLVGEVGGLPADDFIRRLKALCDPVRVIIVSYMYGNNGEAFAPDLQYVTGLAQSTVSHHLRLLREAGLVDASHIEQRITPQQPRVLFTLNVAALREVRDALANFGASTLEQER